MTWEEAVIKSPLGLAHREGDERILPGYTNKRPGLEREIRKILVDRVFHRFIRSPKGIWRLNTNGTCWTKADAPVVEGYTDWNPVHSPNEMMAMVYTHNVRQPIEI